MKIKKALLSVYDKTNIVELAKFLIQHNIEIISTSNTYKLLCEANLMITELSKYTQYPEIIDGRVKTLHPKIYGGILNNRSSHYKEIIDMGIDDIDLVIVNLYPFWDAYINPISTDEQIIEKIDIGGVTLLRAAAKNFHNVIALHNIEDYETLKTRIINDDITLEYRRNLAAKVFSITSIYDANIHNWLNKEKSELPNLFYTFGQKTKNLRSGENPHQKAAFYSHNTQLYPLEQLHGKELSYNNILDIESSLRIIEEFTVPASVIIKHNNPCGVAISNTIEESYNHAFNCDPKSSFGGIVAVNRSITSKLAYELNKIFIEAIISPDIEEDALKILKNKKNLRILLYKDLPKNKYIIKNVYGGFLLQETNDSKIYETDLTLVTNNSPKTQEKEDLLFAWKVCKHVKSNAIVIAKNGRTIGIGAGQMSRIDSLEIAIKKAHNCKGAVLASDAFFPFKDSIIKSAESGITAIIQPGGSIRDTEVIEEANKNNISMLFTHCRNFLH